MPTVNYYLKKPTGRPARSLIFLQFKYKGRKLVYSFGQKINPVDWSKDKKRVKSYRETILNGMYAVNDLLDGLEKACMKYYQEELVKGVPPASVLKFRLDEFVRRAQGRSNDPAFYDLLDRCISGEIKSRGKDRSHNTLKNYATTKGHLQQFDISSRYYVNFENINLDFYQRYTAFLRDDLQLKPNSIAKDISVIKTIMSEAVDSGHTTNIQWRHKQFSCPVEESEPVGLTEKEIMLLYGYDLSGNKRLEAVRDLFVLSCLTGLPYASCAGLKVADIVLIGEETYLKVRSARTGRMAGMGPATGGTMGRVAGGASSGTGRTARAGSMMIIPCHPIVRDIFSKYETGAGRLPRAISNQKFNVYLKEACRSAGLTERGRLASGPERELWQCVSSGTAGRSYRGAS